MTFFTQTNMLPIKCKKVFCLKNLNWLFLRDAKFESKDTMSNRLQSTRLQSIRLLSIRLPVKSSTINCFQSNRLLNSSTELFYLEINYFTRGLCPLKPPSPNPHPPNSIPHLPIPFDRPTLT